jgi:zinc metalloprotease ZmpB
MIARCLVSRPFLLEILGIALIAWVPLAEALTQEDGLARAPEAEAPRPVLAGGEWRDPETGVVRAVFDLDAPVPAAPPEIQARTYLAQSAAEYGLRNGTEDLELVDVVETPLGRHVRFRQVAGGYPVFESDVFVTLAGERVVAVASQYQPGADAMSSAVALSPAAARLAAIAAIGAGEERIGPETPPALGLLRGSGRLLPLAYRVVIPAAQPIGDWEVMVNAGSGAILRIRDQSVRVDGTGLAFDPDPLTTAEVAYNTPGYTDGNDANTPQLAAETFVRPLRDLEFSGGLYHLRGPFCRIEEFEAPISPPVNSPNPAGFQFTRDHQGFEDVEVYWGIDESQRWIQSLGFNNIQNGPIWCDTHGFNGADNSHYIPSTNRLAWGEGGVDDAEDLDVVLHEYGHAIQFGSVPGWGGGDEGAMGEGFGDYWAGSHSAAVSLYRWEWVFNWDGHNPFWPGRILNHMGTYPANWNGGIHNQGQLWSSTLMQIWFETSRPTTDRIVLQHHFILGTFALVTQAAAALVTTDRNLPGNEGLNVDTIVQFCTQRGFFTAGQYEIPAITHTPLTDTSAPGPYPVVAICTSPSGIAAVEVRYGVNGQITASAPMTPTGNPNEYAGQIPDQGAGVTINYFLVAENNAVPAHNKRTDPRGAPSGALHAFDVSGTSGVGIAAAASGRFVLAGNAPNPFNPQTTIHYGLTARGPAELKIYNAAGKLVRVLVQGVEEAGARTAMWDGRDQVGHDLPSGVYLARLSAGGQTAEHKMVLMK